jgi:shikimate kinase
MNFGLLLSPRNWNTMRIFLLGYMASGKSTLGAALAEAWDVQFVDFDRLLEAKLGMPVGQYIEEKGELSFRKAEHEALVSWLERDRRMLWWLWEEVRRCSMII